VTNQISRSEVQKFFAEHRGAYKVAAANLANGGGLTAASALTIRQELRLDGTC
jgi:hypothetical protein